MAALTEWAQENGSWRGHWLASLHAASLRDNEGALRCAEAAYKLAPQEREVLYLYANCLNNVAQVESSESLVHPQLPEEEPASLGWFQAREIECNASEPAVMTLVVTGHGKLEASASQGARRLPVSWTLHRMP